MLPETIRVSVKLEKDLDPGAFLHLLEETLGRTVRPVRTVKTVNLLSLWLGRAELETVRSLPGVLRAEPEGRSELPPKPGLVRK